MAYLDIVGMRYLYLYTLTAGKC